jgi:hypothetical protein
MKRLFLFAACAALLSGCAGYQAQTAYAKATTAYNACLLANRSQPAFCAPEQTVMENDLTLYNNVSN